MSLSQRERTKILHSIRARVLKHHFNVAGVSYDAWTRLVDGRAAELLVADADAFESGVQQLLSELRSSHTVFYHERSSRVLPQHSINATLRRFEHPNGSAHWIFLDVFEDGPAQVAGVKPGDMLLTVDGTAYAPPSMPPFRIGQTCKLSVSNVVGEHPRDIMIKVPNTRGPRGLPIVEPKSLTHATPAPKVGLVKITYFPGAMGIRFSQALDAAIKALKEHGCERLIIDLRGNIGGGLGFARLASYMCPGQIAIGHSLTRGAFVGGTKERSSRGSQCRVIERNCCSLWRASHSETIP